MRILTVCTGNICRSPMAEALLRHHLGARGRRDVQVASAGTWADRGSPPSSGAQHVMQEQGIDISSHRSQPLEKHHLEADLVLVMTSVHVREVLEVDPGVAPRTFMMKELPELEVEDPSRGPAAVLDAARPQPRRSLDVDDPIGLPFMAYERCLGDLESGVLALLDILYPQNGTAGGARP